MCVVSMVIDHQIDKWQRQFPPQPVTYPTAITQEEIDEFRRLLDRARKYDRDNNQPDCELDEKRKVLKDLAEQLGIDISFL